MRRSEPSPRLCSRCAEGVSAIVAAEGSEARVRGELYGRATNGPQTRSVIADMSEGALKPFT
jgi:hypothetical protein